MRRGRDILKTDKRHSARGKILSFDSLVEELERQRAVGRRIVHCHGVFDLVHVGHIRHLEEARSFGDVLVVTVTPDQYVNKGPGRPVFGERLRAEALGALDCVDYVAVNPWATAVETVHRLKPDFFVKGPDYRDQSNDRTGGIAREAAAVAQVGGKLVITDDLTFSSSNLLNRFFSGYPPETQRYLQEFRNRFSTGDVLQYIEGASQLKVLVVGEAIIDEYQYCTAIGKSSKEPTLAVRLEAVERFPGGALAVANHLANFAGKVGAATLMGSEDAYSDLASVGLNPTVQDHVFRREGVPTIVKRRLVERYFFHKLLEIYEMDDRAATPGEDAALHDYLENALPAFDVVVVSDFGHGMITPKVVETLSHRAKFLAVNVQTNAGNMGFNTISRYGRADYVSITEAELRLDARDRHGDLNDLVSEIADGLGVRTMSVTRGKHGCLVFKRGQGFVAAPAVATEVVDRVGAGDAFLAVTALCAAQQAPADVIAFIGNVVGAQAVKIVGNSRSVDKLSVVRGIETLMK